MSRKKNTQPINIAVQKKRKNFRMPLDLMLWAEDYAHEKNTNLTQLIVDHLTALREQETR